MCIRDSNIAPKVVWNNYDKFLLGIKLQNKSLIDRPFLYILMPFYSTGTVSYTHLDVYKRQEIYIANTKNFKINTSLDGENKEVEFAYPLSLIHI